MVYSKHYDLRKKGQLKDEKFEIEYDIKPK